MQMIDDMLKVIEANPMEHMNEFKIALENQKFVEASGKLSPKITRQNISKYEFAAILTKLALYLNSLSSLDQYLDDVVSYNGFINPCELAYKLLMNGRFDATIDRLGYEKVSFSKLKVNPQWCKLLEDYFKRNNDALVDCCYKHVKENL